VDSEHNSDVETERFAARKKTAQSKPKKPKKVTAGYLERAAVHYLGRFSSSEQNLRNVLERKIRRRNENHAPATEEQQGWISDVVAKCVRYDYVDDNRYAAQRAEMLLKKGKPVRMIKQDLRHKGISADISAAAIAQLKGEDTVAIDQKAAAAYIKRRRFGPFRRETGADDVQMAAKREKELASMARSGFAYGLATEMLDWPADDIIDLLA